MFETKATFGSTALILEGGTSFGIITLLTKINTWFM